MELPFIEEQVGENVFVRIFSEETDSSEYVWHRDREDRIIESIDVTNWQIQLDNELPKDINSPIFIPKEVYHRIIKGDGSLKLKVIKL